MEKAEIVVIGAGVIGLAVAAQLSRKGKEIIIVEKDSTFGRETSSRNSEVIHSGIYYLEGSLKAQLCVEGKRLLYEFCARHNIPHKRLGKLIVATNHAEAKELERLISRARNNSVEDLRLLTKTEINKIEPHIEGLSAILSPSTGIVDSHRLMKALESQAEDKGAIFAYGCEVIGITKKEAGYEVAIRDADGERLDLFCRVLINSSGLYSDKIAQMVGIKVERYGYKLRYCKGEYFRVCGGKSKLVSRLIYPTPKGSSLGIHTVTDLQGQLKLGANAFYVEDINYDVEPSHTAEFYESVKGFLPFIEIDELTPDMSGIRPKLQAQGEPVKDFVISHEEDKGFPGFVNLIGIESPGLTASLSIAKYIESMI